MIPVAAAVGQAGQCWQVVVPGVMSQSADVVFRGSGAEEIGDGGFAGSGTSGDSEQQLWYGHVGGLSVFVSVVLH